MSETNLPSSARRIYKVTQSDLPLCCPMPNMRLWDGHPRVYLPLGEVDHVFCPYCDAEYLLVPESEVRSQRTEM